MTREETRKEMAVTLRDDMIIDEIYDDFESRTCENCKYVYMCDIDGHICNNEKSKLFCSKVDNTVYCNKFVSTDTKSLAQD